ncbi:MAG TPA: hypothetical protein VJ754_08125 [Anaerolineae bacterium]|nr:hypothetical protein [Anaerolineae bacterium]
MGNKSKRPAPRQSASRTPLLLVIGGAVLIGAAALLLASSGQGSSPKPALEVTGAPSLKVDKEKVDLGNLKLGQTVNVSFEVTNVGDRQLQFTAKPYIKVAAGC